MSNEWNDMIDAVLRAEGINPIGLGRRIMRRVDLRTMDGMEWWEKHDPERVDSNWGRTCMLCNMAAPAGSRPHTCREAGAMSSFGQASDYDRHMNELRRGWAKRERSTEEFKKELATAADGWELGAKIIWNADGDGMEEAEMYREYARACRDFLQGLS